MRFSIPIILNLFMTFLPSFAKGESYTLLCDGQSIQVKDENEKEILESVCREKEKHALKSVIFGVWQEDKLISSGALGYSITNVEATEEMHFRPGGVMETFLITLFLQLVDEGKVKLDDKLSTWFPDLPDAHLVTLEMLANSTSGYPDYVYADKFIKAFKKDVFKEWTTKALLDIAFEKPMLFKPGTSFHYSHTNFVILGEVLQKITQQSIESLLQEKIFNKLQLNNTRFSTTSEIPAPALHAYSSLRGVYEDSTYWNPSWTSFSGRLTSNLKDLGRWAKAFGTGELLSKRSYQALSAPTTVGKGNNTKQLYFGLGVGILNTWFVQNPSFAGYSGLFAYLPSKKIRIVVFNTLGPKESSDVNYSQVISSKLSEFLNPEHLIHPRIK